MKNKKLLFLVQSAMIAAVYIVLLIAFKPIGSGAIQARIAEALTILPYFTPAAIPGLWVGCFLGNFLVGSHILDIIFGSLATLIAAFGSYKLRGNKFLVPLPPIIANTIIVPWVLRYAYDMPDAIPFLMLTIGIGEVISCGVIGLGLLFALNKYKHIIFSNSTSIQGEH